MTATNEFSSAFSTSFDTDGPVVIPLPPLAACTPDTDWGCAPEDYVSNLDGAVKERSELLAWSTLTALTAYQISACPVTVRPCKKVCVDGVYEDAPVSGSGAFHPGINNQGYWVNSCGCGGDTCSCGALDEIILPGPVGGVTRVTIDGLIVSPSMYRVDNFNRLTAQGAIWPSCQDMSLPITEPGTFSVTYYRGAAPDPLTSYAAGVLAYEFAKACNGGKCRLPSGVTSITRQGVAMEIQTGMWENGTTGIREVDAVIYLYNPNTLKSPPAISSPDVRRPRQTTWSRY